MRLARITTTATVLALLTGCGAASTTIITGPAVNIGPGTVSPAPARKAVTAEAVTAALKAAGLVTGKVTDITAANDTNHLLGRPGGYTSKTAWPAPFSTVNEVEVYATAKGAALRVAYLKGFFGSMLGDGYDYLSPSGLVILRLSSQVPPVQAHKAELVLDKAAA